MTTWTGCEPGMPCGLCSRCKNRAARGFRVIVSAMIVLVSLALLIFATGEADAAIYSSQTNATASTTATNTGTYYFRMGESSGTSTANYVGIKIGSMTGTAGDRICLTEGATQGGLPTNQFDSNTISSNAGVCDHGSGANTLRVLNSSGNVASIRDGEATYVLDASSTTFKAGYYYMFIIGDAGNGSVQTGDWLKSATTHNVAAGTNTTDAYWCMADTFDEALSCTEAPPAPEVEITYPANGSTISDPAFNWTVNITKNTTSTLFLRILYNDFNSSTTFSNADGDFLAIEGSSEYPKGTPLFTGVYYAQARLYDSLGDQVATSTTISFSESFGGASGSWAIASSTNCADVDLFATATLVGQFANSVLEGGCKAGVFLFYPSTSSVQQIVDIKDLVIEKPPLGYFTAILGAINLSTTTKAFAFPTSTIAGLQEAVIDPFDTAFPLLIGLSTGMWIFHRFARKDKL